MEMTTPLSKHASQGGYLLLDNDVCGWVPIYLCVSLCSKINVCMLMYKLLYFLYVVYVCNDESMHTNIM